MEQYEAWKALLRAGEATGWQEFYVKFYQAFIDGSRWKQYLNGVGTTLMVTAMALAIGIVLGILVLLLGFILVLQFRSSIFKKKKTEKV